MSEIIIKYKDKEYTYNYGEDKEAKSQKVILRKQLMDEETKKKLEKQARIKLLLEQQKTLLEEANNSYINDILDKKKSIIKRYRILLKKEDVLFFKLNRLERKLNKQSWFLKLKILVNSGDIEAIKKYKLRQKKSNEWNKKNIKKLKELAKLGDTNAIDKLKKMNLKAMIRCKKWLNKTKEKASKGDIKSQEILNKMKEKEHIRYKRRWNKYRNNLKNNDKEAILKYNHINKVRKEWRIKNKKKALEQKLESQKKAHKGLKDNISLFFNKINKSFNEKRFRKDFQDFLKDLSNKIINKNIDERDKKNLSVLRNSVINVYMFNFIKKYLYLGDLKPITYEIKMDEK